MRPAELPPIRRGPPILVTAARARPTTGLEVRNSG